MSTDSSAGSLTKVPTTRPFCRRSRRLDTTPAMWDVISHSEQGRKSSEEGLMEASGQGEGRGLRRNAVGLPGLIAQSLGVTAPEISAVVIAEIGRASCRERV